MSSNVIDISDIDESQPAVQVGPRRGVAQSATAAGWSSVLAAASSGPAAGSKRNVLAAGFTSPARSFLLGGSIKAPKNANQLAAAVNDFTASRAAAQHAATVGVLTGRAGTAQVADDIANYGFRDDDREEDNEPLRRPASSSSGGNSRSHQAAATSSAQTPLYADLRSRTTTYESMTWDQRALYCLQRVFGFPAFRGEQAKVISACMSEPRRDVFCIMPTGGGKSLCYAVPALLSPGVTIVISPLLSLIQDQVSGLTSGAASLQGHGVPATHLSSEMSEAEARAVFLELFKAKGLANVRPDGSTLGFSGTTGSSNNNGGSGGVGNNRLSSGGGGNGSNTIRDAFSRSSNGASSACASSSAPSAVDAAAAARADHMRRNFVPSIKLLFVTPEKCVGSNTFKQALQCLYDARMPGPGPGAGHDFRPDYKGLSILRESFPDTQILALTATATHDVRQDVVKVLKMRNVFTFVQDFNRPNLIYSVRPKWRRVPPDLHAALIGHGAAGPAVANAGAPNLQQHHLNRGSAIPTAVGSLFGISNAIPGSAASGSAAAPAPMVGSGGVKEAAYCQVLHYIRTEHNADDAGIVYCLSRDECEDLALWLRSKGIKSDFYHAGMASNQRVIVQNAWQRGATKVVVATIAYGMGIDHATVRYVVHFTLAKSAEGYYQESGRAGRDGKPAHCLLLYHTADVTRVTRVITMGGPGKTSRVKAASKQKLTEMQAYCEDKGGCRRAYLIRYFGQTSFSTSKCAGTCDNCHRLQASAFASAGAAGGGGDVTIVAAQPSIAITPQLHKWIKGDDPAIMAQAQANIANSSAGAAAGFAAAGAGAGSSTSRLGHQLQDLFSAGGGGGGDDDGYKANDDVDGGDDEGDYGGSGYGSGYGAGSGGAGGAYNGNFHLGDDDNQHGGGGGRRHKRGGGRAGAGGKKTGGSWRGKKRWFKKK